MARRTRECTDTHQPAWRRGTQTVSAPVQSDEAAGYGFAYNPPCALNAGLVVRVTTNPDSSYEVKPLSSVIVESPSSIVEGMALMLDHPEKTARLLAALKAAAPFEAELAPTLIEHLQDDNLVNSERIPAVWDLSYAGDAGGIMCHIARSEETGRALVVSLTYVRVRRSMPLARAIADYQKHRLKKLRKQGGT
jgi:hypothetical protein